MHKIVNVYPNYLAQKLHASAAILFKFASTSGKVQHADWVATLRGLDIVI